jgi:hypothetical protein
MSSNSDVSFQVVDKRHSQMPAKPSGKKRFIPAGWRAHSVLLGHYDEDHAREFLQRKTLPPDVVDELMTDHRRAEMQLREMPPLKKAPEVRPIQDQKAMAEIARIMSRPDCAAAYPPGSWTAELVEIASLVPIHPNVDVHYAEGLGGPDLDPANFMAAVKLAFPENQSIPFNLSVDQTQKSISLSSINPSVEVVGLRYGQTDKDGPMVVSFMIGSPPNILTVTRFNGRNFLSTGYHRVYRMLKAGLSHVPCVVREAEDFAQTGAQAPGALPSYALMEDRPPLFPDFADPIMGVIVPFRSVERMVRIRPDEYFVFK